MTKKNLIKRLVMVQGLVVGIFILSNTTIVAMEFSSFDVPLSYQMDEFDDNNEKEQQQFDLEEKNIQKEAEKETERLKTIFSFENEKPHVQEIEDIASTLTSDEYLFVLQLYYVISENLQGLFENLNKSFNEFDSKTYVGAQEIINNIDKCQNYLKSLNCIYMTQKDPVYGLIDIFYLEFSKYSNIYKQLYEGFNSLEKLSQNIEKVYSDNKNLLDDIIKLKKANKEQYQSISEQKRIECKRLFSSCNNIQEHKVDYTGTGKCSAENKKLQILKTENKKLRNEQQQEQQQQQLLLLLQEQEQKQKQNKND
jgi:hypothetical protein